MAYALLKLCAELIRRRFASPARRRNHNIAAPTGLAFAHRYESALTSSPATAHHDASRIEPSGPAKARRGFLQVAVRVTLGLLLLGFILSRVDTSSLTVQPGPRLFVGIAAAVTLIVVAQLYSALRWKVILGSPVLTWGYLFRLYLIGAFFSLFLPTSIGGDAVRTTAAARSTGRTGEVISSVLLDRLFGVGALVFYLAVGAITSGELLAQMLATVSWSTPGWVPLGAAALGMLSLLLAWRFRARFRRASRLAGEAWLLMKRCWHSPQVFFRALLLALLVQAVYIAVWSVLAISLGFDLPLGLFLLAVPLVSLAAMLPVTFSGLGVREGAWLLILAPFSLSAADAVTFSLLYFLAFVGVGVIGGLVFVTRGTEFQPAAGVRHR
jgi:uncharacterized membrane protein YbhN (UPF0104 family)